MLLVFAEFINIHVGGRYIWENETLGRYRDDEDENEDKVAARLLRLAILRHSRLAHVTAQSSLYLYPALHLGHLHTRYSGASVRSYLNLHYLSYPLARSFVSSK